MKKILLFNKRNKIYVIWIITVVLLLITLQLTLYLRGFYSISADEAGHTIEGYNWYKGQVNIFSIWLPFQKILYGLSFYLYDNLFWVPRIWSAIFGILTLLSLIYLSFELFQNKIVSMFTGFLGSLFWGLIIFGMLPLLEIYFFFFVVSSIAFFLRWKRTNENFYLLLTIVFSSIGTTTRYEAWTFSFIFLLLISINIYYRHESLFKRFFKIIVIAMIMFMFPLIWIYLSYTITGKITHFVTAVSERYVAGGFIDEIQNNVLYYFIVLNSQSLNILGILTIFIYKKVPQIKNYAIILFSTLLCLSIVTLITNAMPTQNAWRLASVWSILLIPFTAKWLYMLFSGKHKYFKYNFVAFTMLIVYLFSHQLIAYSKSSYMNKQDLIVGKYINNLLKLTNTHSKVLIENNGWKYTNIMIASQQPDRFITEKSFAKTYGDYTLNDSEKFEGDLNQSCIKFLVLNNELKVSSDNTSITKLKSFENWVIYSYNN